MEDLPAAPAADPAENGETGSGANEETSAQPPQPPLSIAVDDSSGIELKELSVSLSRPPASSTAVSSSSSPRDEDAAGALTEEQIRVTDQVSSPTGRLRKALHMENEEWAELSDTFQQTIAEPGRKALHKFFYPPRSSPNKTTATGTSSSASLELEDTALTSQGMKARIADPPFLRSPGETDDIKSNNNESSPSPLHQAPADSNSRGAHRPPLPSPSHPNTTQNQQPRRRRRPPVASRIEEDPDVLEQDRQDREYVEKFWTAYDDIIILSLFTQLGILCRLGMAYWFRFFDAVFQSESALFTNLPLNCLSCFFMGLLCSGESLMQIIETRFSPPRLQHDLLQEAASSPSAMVFSPLSHDTGFPSGRGSNDEDDDGELVEDGKGFLASQGSGENFSLNDDDHNDQTSSKGWRLRLRRSKRQRVVRASRRRRTPTSRKSSWQPKEENLQNELREVQLLALERRIRSSPCLVLFPVKKQDVDVVENYFHEGYRRRDSRDSQDFSPRLNHREASSQEYKEEIPVLMTQDGSSFPDYVEDTAFSFDNHDLALDEQVCMPGNENGSLDEMDEDSEEMPSEQEEAFQDEIVTQKDDAKPKYTTRVASNRDKYSRTATKPADKKPDQSRRRMQGKIGSPASVNTDDAGLVGRSYAQQRPHLRAPQYGQIDGGNIIDYGTQDQPDLDQIITSVATDVSQKISRIRRVRLADGWDVGTTPEEKSEDLMLGLRDGLCGALSSFSSWISAMVNLLLGGDIGKAFVGIVLGIQLPIVAYRFGQYVAVYIFVWRCRRETKQDNRRGYGIRLNMDDDDPEDHVVNTAHSFESGDSISNGRDGGCRSKSRPRRTVQEEESETPSVRAIITAIFIMSLVAQTTSLNFFYEPEDRLVAMSLLFSPLGVLTRWRLSKFNSWRPSFPIGTFACNIGACALSGSLGSLLAGNPGPKERIALVAIIAGFGGTLSSVARFIVEILAGVDPILLRVDGVYYAVNSVMCGLLVSFLFAASVDWADSVE